MRIGPVRLSECLGDGRRLNAGYFLAEDEIAVRRLRAWRRDTAALGDLVSDVYSGPIFRKISVGPGHGVGYVSANSLFRTNVVPSDYLSLRHRTLLDCLRLVPGTIVLTCSGMNLGKSVWVRNDMAGLAGSGDLIRILPDAQKAPGGLVFAFLSSRYGVASIRRLIFGGHIKHIAPSDVCRILVPRLGDEIERRVHDLVEKAATLRSNAAALRKSAVSLVTAALSWESQPVHDLCRTAGPCMLQRRMDAFHHAEGIVAAQKCLATRPSVRLGDVVAEVFEPNRGPRRKVEDASHGVQFLSSSEVFRLDPVGDYLISRTRTPYIERQLVGEQDLLLPRSGQIGGIIGRAVLPLPSYYGAAASEHLVRVRCRSREDAFLAWAIFATEPGYYAAIGTAFGSSIPSLDCALLADLQIPWWEGTKRNEIVRLVEGMVNALTEAISAERSGVALVEHAIEQAT